MSSAGSIYSLAHGKKTENEGKRTSNHFLLIKLWFLPVHVDQRARDQVKSLVYLIFNLCFPDVVGQDGGLIFCPG